MTETDNLTDEELAAYEYPVIEEADEDASPGDLSGGRTDKDGVIEDDTGSLVDVEAFNDEPVASSTEGDAR
jgi:hypothetical protein